MNGNANENPPNGPKSLDKLQLTNNLSRYLSRAESTDNDYIGKLKTKIYDLLHNVSRLSEGEILEALKAIRREALVAVEATEKISKAHKLANDIYSEFAKF